ncbi:MAG TPA: HlyD family efflux transporter periplasmic adaptor subunit, partial [Myxococcota bacterium]|nr:HlyD family efflux transporter periplasmic adaptor subunit [Myxococcota bacterium]
GELHALELQLHAARGSTASAQRNIDALIRARDLSVESAEARVQTAQHRHASAVRSLEVTEAAFKAAKLNFERQQVLAAKGLTATRQLEQVEATHASAAGEVEKARAAVSAALAEISALNADRYRVAATSDGEVERARAALQGARANEAKLEAEILKLQTRQSRQAAMSVTAPRDGTVLRIVAQAGSRVVKAGDPLAILVPDTEARAVELWVSGLDAPLVTPGQPVRLQFEGWPAVQFTGWPQIAVGTFPGTVKFIDASVRADGKLRLVVVPAADASWPVAPYLRQGVRAQGWVLLNRVSLGYEVWRQLNNFPIAVPGQTLPVTDKAKTPSKAASSSKDE